LAADPTSPLIIEQHRQEQKSNEERARGLIERRPKVAPPRVEVETPTLLPAGQCQPVQRVFLYGADHFAKSERRRVLGPFIGRCLDNAGVARLARAVQEWYLQAGFITTRVSIKQPQNSFDKGNLELWVVEGRIGRFVLGKNTDFDQRRISSAFPVGPGDVLNIHDLDQGLDQLDRLFSQKFRMQIKPGERPGYSNILLIEYSANDSELFPHAPSRNLGRQSLRYEYTNGGVPATGENLHSLSFTRENLIGINDVISATWQRSAPHDKNRKGNDTQTIRVSFPQGYWLFDLNYYKGATVQTINASTVPFYSKQKIDTASIKASRVLFRDQTNKIQAYLQLQRSDRDSYIDETLVQVASRRLASAELGMDFTHYFPDATLTVTPSLKHGLRWLGAVSDPRDIASDQPHANYTLFKLFGLYNRRIKPTPKRTFYYQLTVNGQFSPVPLYGENQFILGGHYSVRGFKQNVLSADSGWSARNDLIVPIGQWTQKWHKRAWLTPLQVRLFADYGRVYAASGGYRGSLGGWGVGLDWHYRWFSLAYTHARSFHGADQFATPEKPIDYVDFTAQMTF